MKKRLILSLFVIYFVTGAAGISYAQETQEDFSPAPDEQQLPKAMHSAMKELPYITVGQENAHLNGNDNRRRSKTIRAASILRFQVVFVIHDNGITSRSILFSYLSITCISVSG